MASQNHDSNVSQDKSWQRPWSSDEVRQNAHNWTLAGDSGLLRHLQEFSQNILTRTHTTGKALDSLIEDINSASTEINNINNRFLCLANTQFVENRVYEDDDKEVSKDAAPVDDKSKEEPESSIVRKVKEALSMSVAVLDTMFEPVEIQASDSDGETENEKIRTKTLLLEPHNPYLNRPLPCLIGSDAFLSDDKIGLGDSPSDGEEKLFGVDVDQDVEMSSDSEIDFVLPDGKRDRDAYSSISSASGSFVDSGIQSQQTKKMKSSFPGNSSSSSELHQPEIQQHVTSRLDTNQTFAEQLAAKLGNVASTTVNSAANSATPAKGHSDDLFGGPLSEEEEDDLFKGSSGLFSKPPKRFFDDPEDSNNMLWKTDSATKNSITDQDVHHQPNSASSEKNQHSAKDYLFGLNEDDEDDDLFSFKQNKSEPFGRKDTTAKSFPKSATIKSESVGDFDPGAETSTPQNHPQIRKNDATQENLAGLSSLSDKKIIHTVVEVSKKPAGGVLLPGLKDALPRQSVSSASESEPRDKFVSQSVSESFGEGQLNATVQSGAGVTSSSGLLTDSQDNSSSITSISPVMSSTQKQFSSDDGYQTRNLFSSTEQSGSNVPNLFQDDAAHVHQGPSNMRKGLFSDVEESDDDLFSDHVPSFKPPTSQPQDASGSIFSQDEHYEDLFSDNKDTASNRNETPIAVKAMGEDSERNTLQSKSTSASFSESSNIISQSTIRNISQQNQPSANVFKTDMFSSIPPPLKSEPKGKKVSLFDDSDSGDDDLLFSSASSAGSRRSQASTDLLSTSAVSTVEKKPLSKKSLFDDDDALFGSTEDDPDVDIFSNPAKPKVRSKPIVTTQSNSKENGLSAPENSKVDDLFECDPSVKNTKSQPFVVTDGTGDLFASQNKSSRSLLPDVHVNSSKDSQNGVTNPGIKKPDVDSHFTKEEDDLFSNVAGNNRENISKLSNPPQNFNSEQEQETSKSETSNSKGIISSSAAREEHAETFKHTQEEKPKKPEPPRTLNIRKETDPSLSVITFDDEEEDDLFGSSTTNLKINQELLKSDKMSNHSTSTLPLNKPPVPSKPLVSTGVSDKRTSEDLSEVDAAPVPIVAKKLEHVSPFSPGAAIQSAIKINPLALLPGAKPPKKRSTNKESSPEDDIEKPSLPVSRSPQHKVDGDLVIGFDQAISISATLPSTLKDRAKLGTKRRPPSNKARREAARASQSFDNKSDAESPLSPDAINTSSESGGDLKPTKSIFSVSSNILSPSTDEDDLFGVPQDLPPEYGRQHIPSTDIFGGAPILSPASASTDQLFTTNVSKTEASEITPVKSGVSSQNLDTQSLHFSESYNSDNSLFSSLDTHPRNLENPETEDSAPQFITSSQEKDATLPTNTDSAQNLFSSHVKSVESESTESIASDARISSLQNDDLEKKTVSPTNIAASVHIDPLINVEHVTSHPPMSVTPKVDATNDDHSSLFPFVKKKSDLKDTSSRPLFSKTPSLPSKAEDCKSNKDLENLDVESDLFAASTNLHFKKSEANILKRGNGKSWPLSDDEDDDLFMAGGQQSKESVSNHSAPRAPDAPSGAKKPQTGNGLFAESDENDDNTEDLFSKSSSFSRKSKKGISSKTSLFDEDDDDLFGSSTVVSQTAVKGGQPSAPVSSRPSPILSANTTKLKSESTFDDPLMALNRDD